MHHEQSAPPVNLFRQALLEQHNLILLAGAAGLSLALATSTPLLVALGGEVLWLLLAPRHPSFRRWAAQRAANASGSTTPVHDRNGPQLPAVPARRTPPAAQMVDPDQARRAHELQAVASEIQQLAAERGADGDLLAHLGGRLYSLQQSFLRMATVQHKLSRFLGDGRAAQLEQEVVRLGQALATEKDLGVKLSLRQALSIGQRQLKQHEQIENTRRALDVKLATLEMSFGYLRSVLVGGGTGAELISHLEELESGTGFVSELEDEATAAVAGAGGGR